MQVFEDFCISSMTENPHFILEAIQSAVCPEGVPLATRRHPCSELDLAPNILLHNLVVRQAKIWVAEKLEGANAQET
jgi:hypothetical protein